MSAPPTGHRFYGWAALLLVAVCATYANHFHNEFHFDDFHTVTDNPALRSLHNIPRFFQDGRTFSTLAANQGWRPLVSTSLAFDYWLGGGYRPPFFHLTTFVLFLLLLVCLFVLFRTILDRTRPQDSQGNAYLALYATALYGLHPVCAETINYIIQRADLYVGLGFVAALGFFAARPRWRRFGLYLVPFALAALSKPTALAFPLVLGVYVWLFEEGTVARRFLACLPALLATVGFALLHRAMTPPTYTYGGYSAYAYRITQPWVALFYVRSLFWPTALSADTDWSPFSSALEPRALAGFVFLLALLALIGWTARQSAWRPVAFGLSWFVVTNLPTALAPLAEVTNDHRMFTPLMGLVLAAVYSAARLLGERLPARVLTVLGLLVLLAFGAGTAVRNRAWATEETLWADVVAKSPLNGRGWMNYGLVFMQRGQYQEALDCFNRALPLTPSYSTLEINLGVVNGAMAGHEAEAERHFARAAQLDGRTARPDFYYARWLRQQGRLAEALQHLQNGLRREPGDITSRDLLMDILKQQHDWANLQRVIDDTRREAPDDPTVEAYATMLAQDRDAAIYEAEQAVVKELTPHNLIRLSAVYHQAGRYGDCIAASRRVLAMDPTNADAWNNIAAAWLALKNWDAAITAADRAIAIKPDFQLARNNRAYAEEQKRLQGGSATPGGGTSTVPGAASPSAGGAAVTPVAPPSASPAPARPVPTTASPS